MNISDRPLSSLLPKPVVAKPKAPDNASLITPDLDEVSSPKDARARLGNSAELTLSSLNVKKEAKAFKKSDQKFKSTVQDREIAFTSLQTHLGVPKLRQILRKFESHLDKLEDTKNPDVAGLKKELKAQIRQIGDRVLSFRGLSLDEAAIQFSHIQKLVDSLPLENLIKVSGDSSSSKALFKLYNSAQKIVTTKMRAERPIIRKLFAQVSQLKVKSKIASKKREKALITKKLASHGLKQLQSRLKGRIRDVAKKQSDLDTQKSSKKKLSPKRVSATKYYWSTRVKQLKQKVSDGITIFKSHPIKSTLRGIGSLAILPVKAFTSGMKDAGTVVKSLVTWPKTAYTILSDSSLSGPEKFFKITDNVLEFGKTLGNTLWTIGITAGLVFPPALGVSALGGSLFLASTAAKGLSNHFIQTPYFQNKGLEEAAEFEKALSHFRQDMDQLTSVFSENLRFKLESGDISLNDNGVYEGKSLARVQTLYKNMLAVPAAKLQSQLFGGIGKQLGHSSQAIASYDEALRNYVQFGNWMFAASAMGALSGGGADGVKDSFGSSEAIAEENFGNGFEGVDFECGLVFESSLLSNFSTQLIMFGAESEAISSLDKSTRSASNDASNLTHSRARQQGVRNRWRAAGAILNQNRSVNESAKLAEESEA